MSLCLRCAPDGTLTEVRTAQGEIASLLGGTVTFVGAMPDLGVFLVARRLEECEEEGGYRGEAPPPVNAGVALNPLYFHEEARGDVFLIASGGGGEEVDVDVQAVRALWCEGRTAG